MQYMDKEISTYQSKCAECSEVFDHPSLGDMVYGKFIFCSENGKVFAYCNAFEVSAKLIDVLLLKNRDAELFQSALAGLADPIFGQQLTNKLHCPKCHSTNLEYWHGEKSGSMSVTPATYNCLLSLSRDELKLKVSQFLENHFA